MTPRTLHRSPPSTVMQHKKLLTMTCRIDNIKEWSTEQRNDDAHCTTACVGIERVAVPCKTLTALTLRPDSQLSHKLSDLAVRGTFAQRHHHHWPICRTRVSTDDQRAFSVAAARVCNALPRYVTSAPLKSYLQSSDDSSFQPFLPWLSWTWGNLCH